MGESNAKIKLKVKEMSSSVAFYRSIGFMIPQDVNTENALHIENDEGPLELVLIPEDQIKEELIDDYELIQISYPNTEAVDQAYNKAASNGCKIITKPWNTFWGTRSAKIIDPDGHNILLYTNIV